MIIDNFPHLKNRKPAGMLVIPFCAEHKKAKLLVESATLKELSPSLEGLLEAPLASGDFSGKEGEVVVHYISADKESRLALLGLGKLEEITVETVRKAFAQLTRTCHKKKIKEINLLLPEITEIKREELVHAVFEGLLLPNYVFKGYKEREEAQDTTPENDIISRIAILGGTKGDLEIALKSLTISESINMARDLINGNADDITPQHLAAVARGVEKTCKGVTATVFDKKRIQKEGLGLLLAVNQGSHIDPAFIILQYKGNPRLSDHTVIVGKGITFDTGGLNLKPTGGMEEMKRDMAGAAVAMAVVHAAASLNLKFNVTAILPTTENSISSSSYKPGDVYKGFSGKSVEIGNTDAEGRLVLSDALSYAVANLKPTRMIDIATLTGSVRMALGTEICGLYSNNDVLADQLMGSSIETGEWLCRLPLHESYRELLKSDIADIKSTGGSYGGSILAALFLKEFVKDVPWAHLDIAGTAYAHDAKRYFPKYSTGFGVRLLLNFLEKLSHTKK